MKSKFLIYSITFIILFTIGCKKTVSDTISPFTLQTHLGNGSNFIHNVFSLPDNTFVIMTQDRNKNISKLFRYNSKLYLMDSMVIEGEAYSKPIIEPDNTFLMLGDGADNSEIWAVKINTELKVVKKRNIEFLYPSAHGELRYYNKLTKLSNGNYVIGTTHEQYPNLKDKIVLFCLKDIFTDNLPVWVINPTTYNGEWMEELMGDDKNNVYIAATDHLGASSNYVLKYDGSGNFIYKNYFPHTHENFHLYLESEKVIYHDYENFYTFDTQGNLKSKEEFGRYWLASSDLIKEGKHYYYVMDNQNSDGNFAEVRKTDENLKIEKSKLFGNRGTNSNVPKRRFMIKLSSGIMVAITLVENPNLSGNLWLLQRFDTELKMD